MLRTVKELAGEHQIVGLAPSASAVHVLSGEADIPARTLQGFLTRYRDVGDGIASPERTEETRRALGGAVLILDEASMVGTVQMRALTTDRGADRRSAAGPDRRPPTVARGGGRPALRPVAGRRHAHGEDGRGGAPARRGPPGKAVLHMVADEPRLAVEELGNGVLEMEGDELGRKAAQLWLDLDPSLRAGTAILAPTHELRAEINTAVRQGLEDEGVLHGPELEIERYVNLHLTRSQKGDVANYRPGDVAVFHHDVYGVKAKAGDACRVLETEDGGVLLAHPDGRERRIDPAGYIRYRLDLYETTPMVLKAGDHARWTRNDTARGLINGEHAEVLSIGPVNVRMRTQDGREIAMARDDPQLHHLDHAYSSTVHAAQGLTCDRVIAVLDTDRGAPADQAMFYVELTRARDNVVLLTDDREALIEALETSPAEELSALRAIGEQFEASASAPAETITQYPPPERPAVMDEASRERRREAERFVDQALASAAASLRERDERAREAHTHGAHVTLARGYAEWREGAGRALADCRRILDAPETFGRHLDRRPGAADEMRRLSARLESDLKADRAEIERRQQQHKQEQEREREREHQKQERQKAKTRDMGGLEL